MDTQMDFEPSFLGSIAQYYWHMRDPLRLYQSDIIVTRKHSLLTETVKVALLSLGIPKENNPFCSSRMNFSPRDAVNLGVIAFYLPSGKLT